MLLKGSCHCQSVTFEVESAHHYPFMNCYCSICRKTAGGGGFAINLGATASTLNVDGGINVSIYKPIVDGKQTVAERNFCKHCGSSLWVFDPRWPDLVHPFASAIDSDLPKPPERVHIMQNSKANWVDVSEDDKNICYAQYPNESLAQWHKRHDLCK